MKRKPCFPARSSICLCELTGDCVDNCGNGERNLANSAGEPITSLGPGPEKSPTGLQWRDRRPASLIATRTSMSMAPCLVTAKASKPRSFLLQLIRVKGYERSGPRPASGLVGGPKRTRAQKVRAHGSGATLASRSRSTATGYFGLGHEEDKKFLEKTVMDPHPRPA